MFLHHVIGRPWAVTAEIADQVQQILEAEGYRGLRQLAELHRDARAQAEARAGQRAGGRSAGSVAIIPVFGFLTHRGDIVDSMETTSTAALADAARAAAADPAVDSILLELDSPGGEVYGVTEAAAALRQARSSKPVIAAVNTHATSAAYWLAAQADEIVITPSGEVGSIGVFGAHEDKSEALKAQGRKITIVSAGKYKVERSPHQPLSGEALSAMQADVDRYYAMFVSDVAKGRKVPVESVRSGFGEGRVIGAKDSVAEGMATSVGTLEEAVRRAAALGSDRRRSMSALAAAQVSRVALGGE